MPRSRGAQRRGSARPTLSREAVLTAALGIVDDGGVEALTMRRVATELQVDPMTIYRHVEGKDGLLDGVVERVWSEVPATIPEDGDWDTTLRAYGEGLQAAIRRHPNAGPLLVTRDVFARASLDIFDLLLTRLRDAGFPPRVAGRLIRALTMVVLSDVTSSRRFRPGADATADASSEPATDAATDPSVDTWISLARSLPDDTPTHLVRTAHLICVPEEVDDDTTFLVDLILRGAAEWRSGDA